MPFASLPYLFVVIVVAYRVINDPFIYPFIIISSATGASIGKLVIYSLGRYMRRRVSEETRENLSYLSSKVGLYGFILILIAASTPIPDDLIYFPAGFTGFNLLYYISAVFIGKIIITAMTLYIGLAVLESLAAIGLNFIASAIIFLISSLYISYLLAKINWRYVFEYGQINSRRKRIILVSKRIIAEATRSTKELISKTIIIRKHIKYNRSLMRAR